MGESLIHQKIPAIMAEIGAIGKTQQNKFQHYSFRGIDDVYNILHGILVKHEVFIVPEILKVECNTRESNSGGTLVCAVVTVQYTMYATDGSNVISSVCGEGMDSGDKAIPKAMSGAHKTFFLQTFVIPTDEPKDSENDSPELKPSSTPPPKPPTASSKPIIPSRSDTEVDEKVGRQLILEEMREVMTNEIFTDGDREAAHSDVAKAKTIRDLVVIKNSWRKELAKREAE